MSPERGAQVQREVEDIFPLSPMQEGMLLHALMSPQSGQYFEQGRFELEGALDASALRRAWERVVERHAVLRTRFVWEGLERPLQVVEPAVPLPWEEEDWGALTRPEQEARFEDLVRADLERGFELGRAPLMRLSLVGLGPERHRLVWSFHHLLLDGWSMPLLWKEVLELYRSFTRGDEAELADVRPYREYIAWLAEQDLGAAERHWREELQGFAAPTPLVVDRGGQGGPGTDAEVGERSWALSEQTTAALKGLGQKHGLTLNSLLQGAWAVLLSRYSGERDVLFGVTVSGRPASLPGVETMVGLFINTLPMRVEVSDERPLLEWLKDLQSRQVNHRQYEHSPLAQVQQWSGVEGGRALFESLLAFENYPVDPLLGDLALELRVRSLGMRERTNYPLTLMAISGSQLGLRFLYERGRFDEEAIVRLEGHLTRILEGLAAAADGNVGSLPLLTEGERRQLLVDWNATGREYPRQPGIGEVFESQAKRTPDTEAVVFDGDRLSYGELNGRANQLAHYLRSLGVGPEARVGICVERSLEMVVGLLGILKAGAAYVPLDPSYPSERLAFMLEDSEVAVLLSQVRLEEDLPATGARVVCLDRDWAEVAGESRENLATGVDGESLAYVVYTSGSTGTPKGVEISHRAVGRLVLNTDYVRVEATDRIAQASNASFDAATFEVWGALLNGACLVGISREVSLVPEELGGALKAQGVTILFLTTALFNAVAREDARAFSGLKHLLFGGEAVDPSWVKEVLGHPERLLHVYGPTETTTFATWQLVKEVAEGATTVPIGRSLANTVTYVLDPHLRPVPVGVPGELFIGGDGLARGYQNQPGLTAERFVPDPFGEEPGGRLYRTGDLVRWLADGTIEFLGRKDHQVKLRGFRVEPGEIESALGQHPGVKDVVVVVREDHPGERRLVAYVTAPAGGVVEVDELRRHVQTTLPEYMVPSTFVSLESLPLSPNGKVDRQALPAPEGRPLSDEPLVPPRNALEKTIADTWREVLHLEEVGVHDSFFDLGGHSLALLRVYGKLRENLRHGDLKIVDLFHHPTVSALAAHLAPTEGGEAGQPRPRELAGTSSPTRMEKEEFAIVGLDGRFPGARDVDELWGNVRDGVESITFFSREDLEAEGLPSELYDDARYVRAGGILEGVDLFDASFFGYNAREAAAIDPQHRVFLEVAWAALEKAGYGGDRSGTRVGVFAGAGFNTYLLHLATRTDFLEWASGLPLLLSSDKDFLTTRVSYKLNLRGPSVDVQTACSTSLVAVHLACQSLRNRECDMALAGGVSIGVPQRAGYFYEEEGILSPDGHCRAFDRRAQGTVGGRGVGVVVLKRLGDALEAGDTVEAVIKGSAINNDGALKVGYTAPGVEGQAEVIAAAHAAAGVEPETIGYIEAHGTGTALGDPIEIQALQQAFRKGNGPIGACAIGALKANVGHLDAAAGVAGLIKTVLALKHRQIPPSLHFEEANPSIDFDNGPFHVSSQLSDWKTNGTPRRAGVSSFGLGGTNAHVVLEEAPPRPTREEARRPRQLLVLSARTPTALEKASRNLARHLEENPDLELGDVAFTLQVGRAGFVHRRAAVCRDLSDAARVLAGEEAGRLLEGRRDRVGRGVAFLFPGQGAQHPGMCRDLYREERAFREEVDRGAEALRPSLGFDLRDALFPAEGGAAEARRLDDTALAQPALFVTEYALARLWMERGVEPEALLGHSVGELVAATLAGVFAPEDALSLVAARGRLMQDLPSGAMLAVASPEPEVRPLLFGSLGLAATNGPSQCVVSGSSSDVEVLEDRLNARDVESHRLRTSHAFHSSMMEPAVGAFRARVDAVERHAPKTPFISNVTGTWITAAQAVDAGYWARQLREPVRFNEGVAELLKESHVVVEVGPGRTLSGLARQHPGFGSEHVAIPSARHPRESRPDDEVLLEALGRLWVAGVDVDWKAVHAGERLRRVALPSYPFERQRYWIEATRDRPKGISGTPAATGGKKADLADWFYRPTWRSSVPPFEPSPGGGDDAHWLVFIDGCGLGPRLAERLVQQGRKVSTVEPGPRFEKRQGNAYAIRPGEAADYEALLREVRAQGAAPDHIAHLWGVTPRERAGPSLEDSLDLGFYSLVFLAQALGSESADEEVSLTVATSGMQEVSGEGLWHPDKATVLGPCRVIPQEYPTLSCRCVDVVAKEPGSWREEEIDWLLAECRDRSGEPVVVYRGRERWAPTFEPVRLEERVGRLRERGVYLITGGLGGIGLEIARFLVETVRARLVLVGRRALPERGEWDAWLEREGETDATSRVIRRVQALEARGGEVLVLPADVSERQAMEEALARAEDRFGEVNGVVHAAGVAPGGVIQLKTRDMAARVLAAKVAGTLVLEEVLRDRRPDFVVLCSSLASVLGIPGQSDYCAANAFQDAFAHRSVGAGGPFVLSLNWDTWSEAGMAFESVPASDSGPAGGGHAVDVGILSKEGTEAFARALGQPLPQLLVSTVDLSPRLGQHRALGVAPEGDAAAEAPSRHRRPELAVSYVASRDDLEQAIADVWEELLGFEPVGIHDDFFELGGHSLLAMQMVNRLRQTFRVPLKLQTLFEAPTVAELARAIVEKEARPGQTHDIARLARRIEGLSDEEVEDLLQAQDMTEGHAP